MQMSVILSETVMSLVNHNVICAFDRLNQPPPEEEVIEKDQHEKLIGQLK